MVKWPLPFFNFGYINIYSRICAFSLRVTYPWCKLYYNFNPTGQQTACCLYKLLKTKNKKNKSIKSNKPYKRSGEGNNCANPEGGVHHMEGF